MTTVAEAEALADWVALHNRNLETIYITHAHVDHFYGLSVLLDRFPSARAIATPKTVEEMRMYLVPPLRAVHASRMFPGQIAHEAGRCLSLMRTSTFTLEGHELRIIEQGRTDCPRFDVSVRSVDRPDRRGRRCVQPMPGMYVGDTTPESRTELDRGAGPVGSAEPGDGCRRSQEAWRARLSVGDRGH